METSFTPIASLTGGVLIGLAALLMMASVGRIAGISGIVSRLLPPRSDKTGMPISLAFVAGLLLAAPLINLATGFVPEVSMSGNLMRVWHITSVCSLDCGHADLHGYRCCCGLSLAARVWIMNIRSIVAGLVTGLLFGAGLIVSGMANPAKVQNFLDITGSWDPSLAFVMGGAIAVTLPGYIWLRRRQGPWFAESFQCARLLGGAALFGAGWGLGGFCPGPALASLSLGALGAMVFVVAMCAGFALAKFAQARSINT